MADAEMSMGPPVLFIEDLERSKNFYVDVLGFKLEFGDDTSAGLLMGGDMVLLVTLASASDMFMGAPTSPPNPQAPSGLFNIFVDDVDAAFARLSALGVEFFIEPIDRYWGRRTAHFKDPDGFVWEISQSID